MICGKKEEGRDSNRKVQILIGKGLVTLCDLCVVATASDSKIVTQMKHRGKQGNTYLSVDGLHDCVRTLFGFSFVIESELCKEAGAGVSLLTLDCLSLMGCLNV